MDSKVYFQADALTEFCREVFIRHGMTADDAGITADVLVTADMRGIPSHGIGRLQRYVNGLKTGQMKANAETEIIRDTPVSTVINANGTMGPPVSVKAMESVIEKARNNGASFACVYESNHFGIAGYYAMMALKHDMIGIAMTNTAALGVPTFGRQVMFGTNPLAFCAPAEKEGAFVLDMSTTVVSRGKIEVYDREGKALPHNWAVDKTGKSATDAGKILDDMFHRYGGGILPLGGLGEMFGGYKGYGLAVMVDILCSVLCGAPFGSQISDTATSSARVSHFFGAIKIDNFRNAGEFRGDMDKMLSQLRNTPAAEGEEQVYFAGQKEMEHEKSARKNGIPLSPSTINNLGKIAGELQIEFPASVNKNKGE
ncbi:MAG: malate dehydrogenase [Lentisphaerae bacterium GWF2_44_16]|nr:MAG: malate dehydrogenase [Lentisphaerae bacterium GWF2_44_16]